MIGLPERFQCKASTVRGGSEGRLARAGPRVPENIWPGKIFEAQQDYLPGHK